MVQSEQRTIVDRLLDLDRRIIYAAVIICLAAPLIQPWGLPIAVSDITQDFYNEIEALQPGDVVVTAIDIESGMLGTQLPAAIVVAQHLWEKPGIRIIQVAFYRADGQINFETLVKPLVEDESLKKYGIDWVNVGYLEGKEAALAAFGSDLRYGGKDAYGNTLEGMAVWDGVDSLDDVDLLIQIGGMTLEGLRQLAVPYNLRACYGVTALAIADWISYKQSGMVHGLINDLSGAAEYEFLVGKPGRAIVSSDAISLAHIFLLVIVIFANLLYLSQRGGGGR
jgi:hypothetical protein